MQAGVERTHLRSVRSQSNIIKQRYPYTISTARNRLIDNIQEYFHPEPYASVFHSPFFFVTVPSRALIGTWDAWLGGTLEGGIELRIQNELATRSKEEARS